MADITMCNGDITPFDSDVKIDCPYKARCHRCLAYASERQSYFVTPPYKDGYCENFWDEVRYKNSRLKQTTLEEFINIVKRNVTFRNERSGQAVFNAAWEIAPTEANKYRGGLVDPFYSDKNIAEFITEFFKLKGEESK